MPSGDGTAVHGSRHALAGDRLEGRGTRQLESRARRPRATIARPADARCPAPRLAASRSRPASSRPGPAMRCRRASACPRSACRSCPRPGCRPARSVSIASAFRKSTPTLAPSPGGDHDRHRRGEAERARAGDDQDRHRRRRARSASRGSGPTSAQTTNVSDRDRHDGRHEVARDGVGQPLDRRAAALRLADHSDDLGQQRLGAHAFGPHDEAARRRSPCRRSRGRPAASPTGIGSPVTIDSSTALAPSTTTPSTGTFSPGRTRRRSPTCTPRAARPPRAHPRSRAAPSSARGRAAPGWPIPVRLLARSSSTWPRRTSVTMTAAASK